MRTPLPFFLLFAACGHQAPMSEPGLHVTAGRTEVELGRAFPLTVVRAWNRQREEPGWSDRLLEPLVVRLLETTQRRDETVVEETRRYRAYAFSLGDLSAPVELRVRRALDPNRPGSAELPVRPAPGSFPWWLAGAGAVALLALVIALRRWRAPLPAPPPRGATDESGPGPEVAALERLARLARRTPQGRRETEEFFVEASAIVRGYSGARFSLAATEMTTEELTARVAKPSLADCLRRCDRVKFARHLPDPDERKRILDRAEAFVRETA